MRKQYIRWILPLIALLLIATVMVLTPFIQAHAAGTTTPTATPTAPHQTSPNTIWSW
jgi:hypothetical protein